MVYVQRRSLFKRFNGITTIKINTINKTDFLKELKLYWLDTFQLANSTL